MTQQKRASLFSLIILLALLFNLALPASVLADDEDPPPAPTEEIIVEEESTESIQTDEQTPLQSTPEEATVSEILEQIPTDTELIVLDESGEILPLVTEEAAQVVVTGDPIWCVDGTSPDPTDINCSPAFSNMEDLLDWLNTNDPNQSGTIWIEDSYDSSVNDPALPLIYLDGTTLTNMANNSLTIQGGWSGVFDNT